MDHFLDPSNHLQENVVNLKKTRFTEMLLEANGLDPDHFRSWIFTPGMLFNSPDKWWGDLGHRDFPHEGIDFCLYKDRSGRIRHIDQNVRIPMMHDGEVRSIFSDYLGQTVIIEHKNTQIGRGKFISIYAHTRPLDRIRPGVILKEGDIIATIADTGQSKAKILPHLHYTLGKASPGLAYEKFVWDDMRNPDLVALLNPFGVIDWHCLVIDPKKDGMVYP